MKVNSLLAVIDTEGTSAIPAESKVVEVAFALLNESLEVQGQFASLVNPECAIPPSASAVHHIVDADVANEPKFNELCLESMFSDEEAVVFVAHNAQYDKTVLPPYQKYPWLCTLRLARHLLPDEDSHALQTLRYSLSLPVKLPDGMQMHRAEADVVVATELLKHLLHVYREQQGVQEEYLNIHDVIAFAAQPIMYKKMPFGKHRGELISNIPRSYLQWALANMTDLDPDLRYTFKYYSQPRRPN